MNHIYLDNAATTYKKPAAVIDALTSTVERGCGNPGRSGHRAAVDASRIIADARDAAAALFGVPKADCIAFTLNTTYALNLAIRGVVTCGGHIVTTTLEHNSVSRPLEYLRETGVQITKLRTGLSRGADPGDVKNAIRADTRLVVCTHVSNVTGTVNDVAAIGKICRERGVPFLVDAAQSAGTRVVDVEAMYIDLLAFPGHKGLYGLQGTGGLYVRPGITLKPLIRGGTGSRSESLAQPDTMPETLESGTMNTPGLAALAAGVRYVADIGIPEIARREAELTNRLTDGLAAIRGVTLYAPERGCDRGAAVSFRLDNMPCGEVAAIIDASFNIAVRAGLHCASDAHRALGTLDTGGTVRVSACYMNTDAEIDAFLSAVELCAT